MRAEDKELIVSLLNAGLSVKRICKDFKDKYHKREIENVLFPKKQQQNSYRLNNGDNFDEE